MLTCEIRLAYCHILCSM